MTTYLFDSSAIAKRYCLEAGTDRVEALLAESENLCIISRLSVVEIHSVFATKVRRQEITEQDFDLLRRRFLADGKQRLFRVVPISTAIFQQAVLLLRGNALGDALRTLDAIQLAVALDLHRAGRMDYFVTADKALALIATREGLSVVDPTVA
jgi:predicted nucleic acid-binding protein